VHLVTVVGSYAGILPHMLRHYSGLGVNSFIVHTHAESLDDPVIEEIDQIVDTFGAKVASVNVFPWSATFNQILYRLDRPQRPTDWFILADQDELQFYRDGLFELLDYCDRSGYSYVEGAFVDRLAADGRLGIVRANGSIWSQFPLGAFLTGPLLGASVNKIVAVKGNVAVGYGQHQARGSEGCPVAEHYIPVHHFKWVDGLIDRLQHRIRTRQMLEEEVWHESDRFLSYYQRHGRIETDDPRFLVSECGEDYPHWDKIKEWRTAARFF
jgi:hypothetical protein